MTMLSLLSVVLFAGCGRAQRAAKTPSTEAQLVQYLLGRGYDPSSRPTRDESVPIVMNITVNQFSLYQVDQARETIEFSAEFLLSWHDAFMSWDRRRFNITWAKVKESAVWKPDVMISTSVDTEYLLDADERYVDVKHDGTVRQSYYGVFVNTCKMKVNCFPYDQQECPIEIGPWSYTSEEVYSTHGPAVLEASDKFKGNSEWEFIDMAPHTENESDADVNFNYTTIVWQTKLKRKPQFYFWVLLVPSFIITTIALFGIFIPTNQLGDREEKVSLGLTTLLSTAVILEIVASTMPKASALPMLGNFILAEIFITAIGVLFSVALLVCHHRAVTRRWRPRRIIRYIAAFPFNHCIAAAVADMRGEDSLALKGMEHKLVTDKQDEKNALMSEICGMLDRIDSWLADEDDERERVAVWADFFHRFDILFVIIFQTANVIITLVIT